MQQFIPYRNEMFARVNEIKGLKAIMPKGTLFMTILIDVQRFNVKGNNTKIIYYN